MLSILIPVYRYDVNTLVRTLHRQARCLPGPWEILLLDDASPVEWQVRNRPLGRLTGVHYEELPENVGRAKIRNLLAARAAYPYLLFLDSDSGVERENFLLTYYEQLADDRVPCGGREYAARPLAPEFALHWWYGRQRESRPAAARNHTPHHGFMTNNFVVPRAVLNRLPFDETLLTYGHEDTLFGHRLELAGVAVHHLDNPVVHVGLDPAPAWLRKQRLAIANLYRLHQAYPGLETRALRWWRQLRSMGVMKVLYPALRRLAPRLEKYLLTTERPNLRALDALKIGWLEEEARG